MLLKLVSSRFFRVLFSCPDDNDTYMTPVTSVNNFFTGGNFEIMEAVFMPLRREDSSPLPPSSDSLSSTRGISQQGGKSQHLCHQGRFQISRTSSCVFWKLCDSPLLIQPEKNTRRISPPMRGQYWSQVTNERGRDNCTVQRVTVVWSVSASV